MMIVLTLPLSAICRALCRLGCIVGLSAHAVAGETEWPQFRGPTGQGISAATDLPIAWSATKNVAWSVEIPGAGWSSPVLSGGRLYLTSALSNSGTSDLTLHVFCLDPGDGRVVWNGNVFQPDPATIGTFHRKNSPASPTPIAASERLYVHFGPLGTAALDLDGKVIWRQAEVKYPSVHGGGGSPILADDQLIFSADGAEDPFLCALDARSGEVRWKTARQSSAQKRFSFSTPLLIQVAGGKQVISPTSGFVGGYDPRGGAELWRVKYGEGYSVIPRPVFAHGLLFVSSGFDQPVLFSIKPIGAKGDVSGTHVAWTHRKGVPQTPSMIVVGDEIYFVSDGGIATCADALTGRVHWSERLGGSFSASPVAGEGRIYFQNETGVGFVVKAAKNFELLSKNDLGDRTLASYAVADRAFFIRSEKRLWKIAKPAAPR